MEEMKSSTENAPCANTNTITALKMKLATGDASAALLIGLMYEEGKGICVDYAQANRWYLKALSMGCVQAYSRLGLLMLKQGRNIANTAAAMIMLHTGVCYADASSHVALGRTLIEGRYCKRDVPRGLMALNVASDMGYLVAKELLAEIYFLQQIVPRDLALVKHYAQQAAEADSADAHYLLSIIGQQPRPCKKSNEHLLRAAKMNHATAQYLVAIFYQMVRSHERSAEKYEYWIQRAAENGQISAVVRKHFDAFLLSDADVDVVTPLQTLQCLSEAGDADAMYQLGHRYNKALGVQYDFDAALDMWKSATSHGSGKAAMMLVKWIDYPLENVHKGCTVEQTMMSKLAEESKIFVREYISQLVLRDDSCQTQAILHTTIALLKKLYPQQLFPLALCLLRFRGIGGGPTHALPLLWRAAADWDLYAMKKLAELYYTGIPGIVAIDYAKVERLLSQLVVAGDCSANETLIQLYSKHEPLLLPRRKGWMVMRQVNTKTHGEPEDLFLYMYFGFRDSVDIIRCDDALEQALFDALPIIPSCVYDEKLQCDRYYNYEVDANLHDSSKGHAYSGLIAEVLAAECNIVPQACVAFKKARCLICDKSKVKYAFSCGHGAVCGEDCWWKLILTHRATKCPKCNVPNNKVVPRNRLCSKLPQGGHLC